MRSITNNATVYTVYKININPYTSNDTSSNLLVDSGASANIVYMKEYFTKFDPKFNKFNTYIEMADGIRRNDLIVAKGTVSIPLHDVNGILRKVTLYNVLYIPSFSKNIMSVAECVKAGAKFDFNHKGNESMTCQNGNIFHITLSINNLYSLNNATCFNVITRTSSAWHRIFGHLNVDNVNKLEKHVTNMKIIRDKPNQICDPCVRGKMARNFNRNLDTRSQVPFQNVYIDLNVTINEQTDYNYVLGIIDDYTGYIAVYMLCSKTDTGDAFRKFIADHSAYGTHKMQRCRSDMGKEFMSQAFQDILLERSIKFESCAPYSPHQNGRIERSWRTIFNMSRAIKFDANVPDFLWPYMVKYSVYLLNRSYSEYLGKTPFEVITGNKPNASDLHLFASKCYGYQHYQYLHKFDPRAMPAVFIGYDDHSPAKLLYYPDVNKIRKIRCVKFTEQPYYTSQSGSSNVNKPLNVPSLGQGNNLHGQQTAAAAYPLPSSDLDPDIEISQDIDTHNEPDDGQDLNIRPRRNKKQTSFFGVDNSVDTEECFISSIHFINGINETSAVIIIPDTYEQAMNSPYKDKWKSGAIAQITSLLNNKTWTLVKLPPGERLIGTRWVFSIKTDPSGQQTFKCRLVAKGFSQVPGIHFHETYQPTARVTTIKMLLNLAVQFNLIVHQADVCDAYLNAELPEPIYIAQPEGFINDPTLVCKLHKAIYGLKQSGYLWNKTLVKFMLNQDLTQSVKDPCLFTRYKPNNILFVVIWVDDIILAASDSDIMNDFKTKFGNAFKIKDLGPLKWFLGIQFIQKDNHISMNQTMYCNSILTKFGMEDCKPRANQCEKDLISQIDNASSPDLSNPTSYRELIGSYIYLMYCTRPDIAWIVSRLSSYNAKPKVIHMKIATTLLHYLKYTVNYDLKYVKSHEPIHVTGFVDSSYMNHINSHSTSGFGFRLNSDSALLCWRSGKQSLVAQSTVEAEYYAISEGSKEALFLQQILAEFLHANKQQASMFSDSQGAIGLAKHPNLHRHTRHIEVRHHAIRSYIANGSIYLSYISTNENLSDIFTKYCTSAKLKYHSIIRGKISTETN